MMSMFIALFSLGVAQAAGTSLPPPVETPLVSLAEVPDNASKRPRIGQEAAQVHARLLDQDKIAPGQTLQVGLHLEQDKNWHTYWKSPGDIGLPTSIQWSTPPGW